MNWVLGQVVRDFGVDLSKDARFLGRLRLEAEQVKINLCSSSEEIEQELSISNISKEIQNIEYNLDPKEFKKLITPILDRTFAEVDVALKSAKERHDFSLDDVSGIILVGGSSRIPLVEEAILAERVSSND